MKNRAWLLCTALLTAFIASACDLFVEGEDEAEPPAPATSAPAATTGPAEPTAAPTAGSAHPVDATATDKWTLWTGGLHLRGVDLHPCRLFTGEGCAGQISLQDLQDLRDLGANLINASYPGVFTEQPPYQVDQTNLEYLDNLIEWAEAVDMYVVIHYRTGPGRNEAAITGGDELFAVWNDQAAHDAWVEMWRFTAERYRESKIVVGYDLMVEPHPNDLVDPTGELEPTELQAQVAGTLRDWNALAAETTAAIRAVDPDTPIVVSSIGWASAEWFSALQPTGDARTVYSVHAYDPDVYVVQDEGEIVISYPDVVDDYGEQITFDRAWLEENYRPVQEFAQQHGVPIYVGEFGAVRWVPGVVEYLRDLTNIFEQAGWNYAVYVWRGDEPDFDGFNLELGLDPSDHTPDTDNPLLGLFRERWAQNVERPGAATAVAEAEPAPEQAPQLPSGDAPFGRDFALPLPLFAPDSAWNQRADTAAVLPESDRQILSLYRVLLGDISTLKGYDEPATTWPYMDVGILEFTIPIYRAGDDMQQVVICADEGVLGWPHPKFGIDADQAGVPVTVPAPAGTVRAAGPENSGADGQLVLYDPGTFTAYDYFAATLDGAGDCRSFRGGMIGDRITEAGVVDFFDVRGPGANADGLYSARAVGTPLLGGLIIPEDIESGVIAHALEFAIPGPRNTSRNPEEPLPSDYFYPASTTETDFYNTDPDALAAGQRIRLKQTLVNEEGEPIDESQFAPITRMFLNALRDYGAYLVDNAGGFSFNAEDYHTAVLRLSDDEVNALIGQPAGTPLPEGMTKWQIVFEKLGEDLELIPLAVSPGDEEPDPETAEIEFANFEVVEPANVP